MSFVNALTDRMATLTTTRALTESQWLIRALAGGRGDSVTGRSVSSTDALGLSAVWACVRLISGTVGKLPYVTYRRLKPRGKERDERHWAYRLLHDRPNPEMTALEFREALTGHVVLRGNGYAEIQRNNGDVPIALWPLRPDMMLVERDPASGELRYRYRLPQGGVAEIPWRNMLHLRGFGYDGCIGYSPLTLELETFATGLASRDFGGRFFANDSTPRGFLRTDKRLTKPALKRLGQGWRDAHQGLTNAHRTAVLEEGVTWQATGIAPRDAQLLELRQYSDVEIARIFRVPPHKIADLTRATFSNIEHQAIEYVSDTVTEWCERWEQAVERDLFDRAPGDRTHFAEHVLQGLLRGDMAGRSAYYKAGREGGWLTANEIRELENLNPLDGGDELLTPLNMQSAGEPDAQEPAA